MFDYPYQHALNTGILAALMDLEWIGISMK